MASIAKRDDGRWRARYRDSGGNEHSRHFTRRVDAQRWLDSVTTAVQTGTYVDPAKGKIMLGEWADRWLGGQGHLKPSTYERYAGIVRRHVLPQWSDVPLVDISHADVQGWVGGRVPNMHSRLAVGELSICAPPRRELVGAEGGFWQAA